LAATDAANSLKARRVPLSGDSSRGPVVVGRLPLTWWEKRDFYQRFL
jgi:hypothetical protein